MGLGAVARVRNPTKAPVGPVVEEEKDTTEAEDKFDLNALLLPDGDHVSPICGPLPDAPCATPTPFDATPASTPMRYVRTRGVCVCVCVCVQATCP